MALIDELIVRLGIDSKDLTSKGGASVKTLKDVEVAGAKTEGSVKKVGETSKVTAKAVDTLVTGLKAFAAVLGTATAVAIAFSESIIESTASIDRLSKNLELSAGEITAWGNAAEELGGSSKDLQSSLSMISEEQTKLSITGESKLIPYFSALDIAMSNTDGSARKTTDILKDLAGATEGRDRRQAHNLLKEAGFNEATINLLLVGRRELELTLKRQAEYGEKVKQFAPEASKLQKALVDIKQQFTLVGLSLLQQAAPALEKVLALFQSFGGWIQANLQFIKDLGIVLGSLAAGIGLIVVLTSPITLTVAAIIALGVALALLWQDYQKWKSGGHSFIEWQLWKDRIDAVKNAIAALRKELEKLGVAKAEELINKIPGVSKLNEWMKKKDTYKPSPLALGITHAEGSDKKGTRGQRNNNPGNMEYGPFTIAHGATGSDGRFAIFPDLETGQKAMDARLSSGQYAGKTDEQKLKIWAPASENDTASYALNALRGIKGASSNIAAAGNSGPSSSTANHDNSITINNGNTVIQTPATDAMGIARDWVKSFSYQFVAQANSGLS